MNKDSKILRLAQVKARVTEAIYSGCCLFEHHSDHMTDMLVEGKEYVSFTTKEDCLTKVRWHLEHPEVLREIAQAGRYRANKDYSPLKWWSSIFSRIGKEQCLSGMYD